MRVFSSACRGRSSAGLWRCLFVGFVVILLAGGVAQARQVTILTWNILRYGLPTDPSYLALVRVVETLNPDIILFQEAVDPSGRSAFMAHFASRYPYTYLGAPDETARSQILSQFPLVATGQIFAPDAAYGGDFVRPTIWADIDLDSPHDDVGDLRVYSPHYKSGSGGTDAATRLNQATKDDENVAALIATHPGAQIYYSGDLNAEVGEAPITMIASHLTRLPVVDPNNGSAVTRPESGRTIDHIFYSAALNGRLSSYKIFNSATGTPPAPVLADDSATTSDHLCLLSNAEITTSGAGGTPSIQDVRINEVFADHDGSDTVEFVEFHGPAGLSLTGLTFLVIEGDGTSKGRINSEDVLTGTIPANGLWVMGTTATPNPGTGQPPNQILSASLQNGTQTYLLVANYPGVGNKDVDIDNDGVADIIVGTIIDSIAVTDGGVGDSTYYGAPVRGPVMRNNQVADPAGVARKTNGLDTDSPNDWCFTSFYVIPPATDAGADGFLAASPGVNNAYSCEDVVPIAQSGEISLNMTSDPSPPATVLTLAATDPVPGPNPALDYVITSLPLGVEPTSSALSGGTFVDPADGTVIGAGMLPYTLKNNGNLIHFKLAANVTGWFAFKFKVFDGANESGQVRFNIFIQGIDRLVISEIMYDPSSRPDPSGSDPGSGENDWEWIEVYNLTDSPITLHTLLDGDLNTVANLTGRIVPAKDTRVIAKPNQTWWQLSQLLTEWSPLASASVLQLSAVPYLTGAPKLGNSGDTLRIFDSTGALLDMVHYENGVNNWPLSNDRASIYLRAGRFGTLANDNGQNWSISLAGSNGAWATPDDAGDPLDSDIGSPAIVPSGATSLPPVASNGEAIVPKNASPGTVIALVATDPDMDPLTYIIVSGPAGGSLTDPNNAEADVTGGGTLATNQVRYTPALGTTGDFTFIFKANDGVWDSNEATMIVHIVDASTRVVITEIMYNPRNDDAKWEWVEVHNLTASPIGLKTLNDANNNSAGNLTGMTLPANGTMVITKAEVTGTPSRTMADFLAEWSPLAAATVFGIASPATLPSLNNSNNSTTGIADTLTLIGADDMVLDTVSYQVNTNGWPASNGESSIYLKSGHLSTTDNDIGANWASSTDGVDGAYKSFVSGTDTVYDVGSPGILPVVIDPPAIVSAISRKTHGTAGPFDIPVGDSQGSIECRKNGPTLIIVTFDRPIQQVGGTTADVTLSSGTVGSLNVAGSSLEIAMSGAANPGKLTIAFPGIATAGYPSATVNMTLCVRILYGDASNDGRTNVLDLSAVKPNVNIAVSAANFRCDVTGDGRINVLDMTDVKNNLNKTVGVCP